MRPVEGPFAALVQSETKMLCAPPSVFPVTETNIAPSALPVASASMTNFGCPA